MNFKKIYIYLSIITASFFIVSSAEAWQCHLLVTYPILKSMPEISQQATIPAETLTNFLEAESENLVSVLRDIDSWQPSINSFPPLPIVLTFNGKSDPQKRPLMEQFTDRARIHPQGDSDMHYDTLFVEYAPGDAHRIQNPLPIEQVILPSIISETKIPNLPLERVNPGELISPFEIITSAVDEPDFGMDINLFEDNGTAFGNKYQLGDTPKFTNKTLTIGTQAPFHMGLYYETASYWGQALASFINPCLSRVTPEYRIHYFLTLSRYAFKTKHYYWGYRFLGWALHYSEDLSQPYHTSLFPGYNTVSALSHSIIPSTLNNFKNNLTNQHFAIENYQYNFLNNALLNHTQNNLIQALENRDNPFTYRDYDDFYPRQVIAKESHDYANEISESLMKILHDQNYNTNEAPNKLGFGDKINLFAKVNQDKPTIIVFNKKLAVLFNAMSSHTQKIIRYALQ